MGRLCIKPPKAHARWANPPAPLRFPAESATRISLRNRKPWGLHATPAGSRSTRPRPTSGASARSRTPTGRPVLPVEQLILEAVHQAEAVHRELEGQVAHGNGLSLQGRRIRRQVAARLACLLGPHDQFARRIGNLAVRPGADAEVVAKGPVVEVVRATRPGTRIAGHFVLLETRRRAAAAANARACPRRLHRPAARAARPRTRCPARW